MRGQITFGPLGTGLTSLESQSARGTDRSPVKLAVQQLPLGKFDSGVDFHGFQVLCLTSFDAF